ncbi:hypothetical protein DMUE_5586 [Dictyocoela muelleri]|nr:hypothetical protein DMUE_5586 [Dictyocoela muelleri]
MNIIRINTAPYNPTSNSIAERINQEIRLSLRLSRGISLNDLEKSIWKRINLMVNSTTVYTPLEIFKSKPIFSISDNKVSGDKNEIIKRIKTKMQKKISKNYPSKL